jgi:hypothetical protein
MTRRSTTLAALALSAVLGVGLKSADAYWPDYSYPYAPLCQWDGYCLDSVPYYVSHPPIYYGYSMLRPVDPWYPFRPAPVVVYEVQRPAPQPKMIINPFVERSAKPEPGKLSKATRIRNPCIP